MTVARLAKCRAIVEQTRYLLQLDNAGSDIYLSADEIVDPTCPTLILLAVTRNMTI
jgi:hypothetical protein